MAPLLHAVAGWFCSVGCRRRSSGCAVLQPHDRRDAVAITYRDSDRSWISIELSPSGPPSATRRDEHGPIASATPIAAPELRAPRSWLGALDGLEIVSGNATIAASVAGWLTVCRIGTDPACAGPAWIEPLRREHVALADTSRMFGDLYSVGFRWWTRDEEEGATEDVGQGDLFVVAAETVMVRAMTISAMERRVPASDGRGGYDVVGMESFDTDVMSENCLQAGRPTGTRERENEDGDRRSMGHIDFERAPDTLPAIGVADPLRISMEGAWTILPEGGLRRRSRRCPEM